MAHEEWRDVVGYEGLYQVSSLGRVKSLGCMRKNGANSFCAMPPKIMKTPRNAYGYPVVSLHKSGKSRTVPVHRLVAMAFIENQDNKRCIDHINAVRDDNRVENLRWASYSENARNMVNLGRQASWADRNLSESSRRKFISSQCKPVVRSDGKRYESAIAAARDLGYETSKTILDCLKGRTKTARGFGFRYD